MRQRTVPRSSVCADWVLEGGSVVLRVQGVDLRQAWSNGLIWLSLVIGFVTACLVLVSGGDTSVAVLAGVLCTGLCVTVVGYMRMGLSKREVEISLSEQMLCIVDGADRTEIRLRDLRRLHIVHDGAPSQIAVDSATARIRCTIGQLYRHNRVERFVAEVPASARSWLEEAGLTCSESHQRGVLRSDFRAARVQK